MTLQCQRDQFAIPDGLTYLNTAYIGPSPVAVTAAGEAGVRRKLSPWEIEWSDFFGEADVARAEFAILIGAEAKDIAIVPAASYGIEVAASNLPLTKGQAIVLLADQFPSNFYAWQNKARDSQGELRIVNCPGDWDWTRAVIEATSGDVAIVALPNCHWTNGARLDLGSIAARCREVGAALVLDLSQSLGVIPFNVATVRPDFMVSASYKWLMGPYSLSYLYAAPWRQNGHGIENTPFARSNAAAPPEWKAGDTIYPDSFMPGARRYDGGERANFALMPMSIAATRQVAEWRPAQIAEYLEPLIEGAADLADELGFKVPPAHARSPHILGVRLPNGLDPVNVRIQLARERIFVSVRDESLRLSPYLFNDWTDVQRLFVALRAML